MAEKYHRSGRGHVAPMRDERMEGFQMATRRILAAGLAGLRAFGMSPALAQQANGVLAGKATDEAKQPYSDYAVQLRDAVSGQVVTMSPLTQQGQFSFKSVPLSRKFLVELAKDN